ncbi:MAG: hypothetical protein AUK48_03360 [Oscillatoriales cyanobacterium CG2_30_44_21]|nr:MAG: hypothetical protein AUK48_03360 [Oscillatoriales cyanobacterium CG2_30_44_21]
MRLNAKRCNLIFNIRKHLILPKYQNRTGDRPLTAPQQSDRLNSISKISKIHGFLDFINKELSNCDEL